MHGIKKAFVIGEGDTTRNGLSAFSVYDADLGLGLVQEGDKWRIHPLDGADDDVIDGLGSQQGKLILIGIHPTQWDLQGCDLGLLYGEEPAQRMLVEPDFPPFLDVLLMQDESGRPVGSEPR